MEIPEVKFYNTETKRLEVLKPLIDGVVKIYTCGPTVYNYPHIGNYRSYIFADILVKGLRFLDYKVDRVQNITDVGHLTSDEDTGEDKLEIGAKREGMTAWEVAKKYADYFNDDLQSLNIEIPEKQIKATDEIEAQIEFVKKLEEKGFTYVITDGVYYDTSKFMDYGKMARLNLEGQNEGARVEINPEKRNPSDFALWKFSPKDSTRDMEWESPWGKGFPGWHIECSAIILKYLGEQIDIHTGGIDHIPVHHTNEIAQTEGLTGKKMTNIWMHNEFLSVDGQKMSKSLGNVYLIKDLEDRGIDPLAFRMYVMGARYEAKLNFTWEAIGGTQVRLNRWRKDISYKMTGLSVDDIVNFNDEKITDLLVSVKEALSDDLDTPKILAIVDGWLSDQNISRKVILKLIFILDQAFLGLNLFLPIENLNKDIDLNLHELPQDIQELISERELAREQKDWILSDQIRDQISVKGYQIVDSSEGIVVRAIDK